MKITEWRSISFHLRHKTPSDTSKTAAPRRERRGRLVSWWMKWTICRSRAAVVVETSVKGHFWMRGSHIDFPPHAKCSERFRCPTAFALWLNKTEHLRLELSATNPCRGSPTPRKCVFWEKSRKLSGLSCFPCDWREISEPIAGRSHSEIIISEKNYWHKTD